MVMFLFVVFFFFISVDMVFVFQFDEEFLGRQEAQAQLLKREEKINELEAELQAYRNQVPMLFSLFVLATSVTVFDGIAAGIPFSFFSHCCFTSISPSGFSVQFFFFIWH